MLTFHDDDFKASIESDTGFKPEWAAEAFTDLDQDVRQSIARIKASGELGRRADPHKLAVGLLASLQGGYTMAQASHDIAPMEIAVRSAIAYIETFADPPARSNGRRR